MSINGKLSVREACYKLETHCAPGTEAFKSAMQKFGYIGLLRDALASSGLAADVFGADFDGEGVIAVIAAYRKYDISDIEGAVSKANYSYAYNFSKDVRCLLSHVTKIKDGRKSLGAVNSMRPTPFTVTVNARRGKRLFPDDRGRAYYRKLISGAIINAPLEIVAYTLSENDAHFVIMSLDQTDNTITEFLIEVNRAYLDFYAATYAPIGNVFANKIPIDKISESEIFDSIALVHIQPQASGMCAGLSDFSYTSFNENPGKGLSGTELLNIYFLSSPDAVAYGNVREYIRQKYAKAHTEVRSKRIGSTAIIEKDDFKELLEQALSAYGLGDPSSIPQETLAKVFAELNELGDFTFEEMYERITAKRSLKRNILVDCLCEMIIKRRIGYDNALRRLGVMTTDDSVLCDIVAKINLEKGYSYDYIMGLLGFSYPNTEFLKRLVERMCDMRGITEITALRELGLHDFNVVSKFI